MVDIPNVDRRHFLSAIPSAVAFSGTAELGLQQVTGSRFAGKIFKAGVHAIKTDTTFQHDVLLQPGARLQIDRGVAATFMGDLSAPGSQIFTGSGTISLEKSRVLAARPEWWGAIPDDPETDCLPAIRACLSAHPWTQLGLGDYYLSSTLLVEQSNRRIWGIGRTNGARGTRLLLRGSRGAVMQVGTSARPFNINNHVRGVDVRWLELGRTEAASADVDREEELPTGLRLRYVLDCTFEGLRAQEHAIGYSARGAVRTFLRDCAAFRSAAGPDPRRDVFVGFDFAGPGVDGMAGTNASLFLVDCSARTGGRPTLATSAGARIAGAFADTYLVRFETTEVEVGITIDGQRSSLSSARRRTGHANLNVQSPVLDQCFRSGITITDVSEHGLIEIRDPYIGLGASGDAALSLARCGGNIDVSGGQLIGWVALEAGRKPTGIRLQEVEGASFTGTKLLGFSRPVDAFRTSGFELAVAINSREGATGEPAVRLSDCRSGLVRPRISGKPGAHTFGVLTEGIATSLNIELGNSDRLAIAGKLVSDAPRP